MLQAKRSAVTIISTALIGMLFIGCPMVTGENSITSELLKPVAVTISGKVVALDTGLPVSGVIVKIQQVNPADDTKSFIKDGEVDASATSLADGTFAFAKALELDVDSYQNYLFLSDPLGAFFDSDTSVIYAMKDSVLAYDNLKMAAKAPASYTVVSGTIKDILASTAVVGLKVTLTNTNDTAKSYTATTSAAGGFSIDKVPVAFYSLELDGSALGTAYIKEAEDIVLENTAANALGDLRVSKASNSDDLRIVLSWTNRSLDLDSSFSLPKPGFNFNHLGVKQVRLPSSIISVNPAFKFAEGTAYWPENMGGAADTGNRVIVNKDSLIHTVSSQTVVQLDKNSADGELPEVTTIYRQHPLTSYPTYLAYHYDFTKASTDYSYYPVGMGVFNVACATATGSIYDSGATVKVYQGSTYLGKFSAADLAMDSGESNRRYWPVLQVEIGYSTLRNATLTATSFDEAEDIYYRVVPYGSAGALPSSRFAGYFYQETALPGNESFTVYLDQTKYVKDYLFGISSPPYVQKLIGSSTGNLYGYDSYAYVPSAGWTNPAVYAWKKHTVIAGDTRGFIMGMYTPLKAQTLYLAKRPWGTADTDPSLFSVSSTTTPDTAMVSESGGGAGRTISDASLVEFVDGHYFTLMATSSGPRGTSTKTGRDTLDLTTFFSAFWEDLTTGTALTVATPRELTHVLAMRDRYGAIGKYALIGGQGLFVFNASYTTFDEVTKASFSDVNNNGNNLSSADCLVRAIAQEPVVGASVHFIVSVLESPSLVNKLYDVNLNLSGAVGTVTAQPNPPPSAVNSILYVTKNLSYTAIAATDTGLYVYDPADYTWHPYLSEMLGTFKITKLFDYNGKLGIFAEGNGLLYGPYPE